MTPSWCSKGTVHVALGGTKSRCDKEALRDVIAGIYAAKLNEYTASGSATPCSQRSARPFISPVPARTRRWSELWSPEPSLGVIIAVPDAFLPVAIFVLLVFRYAYETEIAVAVGEVEWTGDWPGFVGGAPGCGCTPTRMCLTIAAYLRPTTSWWDSTFGATQTRKAGRRVAAS